MVSSLGFIIFLIASASETPAGVILSDALTKEAWVGNDPFSEPVSRGGGKLSTHQVYKAIQGFPCQPPRLQIDTTAVGLPENAANHTGEGRVDYLYEISRFEITNYEYAAFLNSVAAQGDPHGLYDLRMASSFRGGILRIRIGQRYCYRPKQNFAFKPVVFVKWLSAARFANWLHNNQSSDLTKINTGAYDLRVGDGFYYDGPRSSSARWALPNNDEWLKAAFFDPNHSDFYWDFANQSDLEPSYGSANWRGDFTMPFENFVNYNSTANWNGSSSGNLVTVGSTGALNTSYFGVSDMNGNAGDWTEAIVCLAGLCGRNVMGGSYASSAGNPDFNIINGLQLNAAPIYGIGGETDSFDWAGFRVVKLAP